MIYDGLRGYLRGDVNQPANTVLAMTKGPRLNKNWFSTVNPAYNIVLSADIAGKVKLQGTNDVALQDSGGGDRTPIQEDILPTETAVWSDIIEASVVGATTGTFATSYWYIRLIVSVQDVGTVLKAYVIWN